MAQLKLLKMRDGVEIFCRIKEMGGPLWIVATHGVGEHLERHNYLSEMFGQYFNILQYDLRGHGRSGGARGDIQSFDDFMLDLGEVLAFATKEYRMKRYVLFGHSLGSLITASYLQNFHKLDSYPERLFLCAPAGGFVGPLGKLIEYAPAHIFSKVEHAKYGLKLQGLVDLKYLSHDPRVKEAYLRDPLNVLALHTRLLFGTVATAKETFSRPIRPQCPAFCAVGSEDRVVNPVFLKTYFSTIEHSFQFQMIEGAYHELHNEIEKYRKPYFEFLKTFLNDCLYKN